MPPPEVERVATWLQHAERVVVLTGAGISTDSGIPDFRGPSGVWTRDPGAERRATLQNYMSDPEVRREAWQTRLGHPGLSAEPNAGHRALVALERRGKLDTLVTQNIDGLHQAAGSDPATVVEVHGTMHTVVCMSCGERAPMERALDRVRAGEEDPPCRTCGGILKSATISFGQNLVVEDLQREWSVDRRQRWVLDVDQPALDGQRPRPTLAPRIESALRAARLRAERDAVHAVAPGATDRLRSLDLQLRLEQVAHHQAPARGLGRGR